MEFYELQVGEDVTNELLKQFKDNVAQYNVNYVTATPTKGFDLSELGHPMQDGGQIVIPILNKDDANPVDRYKYYFIKPLIEHLVKVATGADEVHVISAKVNITFPTANVPNVLNMPHRDFVEGFVYKDMYSGVLYFNDADGDIALFDIDENKKLTLAKRIQHMLGKVVIFDASIPHAGFRPITEPRYALNFNAKIGNKDNLQPHPDI